MNKSLRDEHILYVLEVLQSLEYINVKLNKECILEQIRGIE